MNVLLIRSDLPESPEVLLLAGMLADSDVPLGWIPTPEVIVCKLIKIWAWVAEHGHRDSDSLDYWIPAALVAALEKQFACSGLLAAMASPNIDWCRDDSSRVAFCRFAEWNGDDAVNKRRDSVRARKSRSRSRARMGVTGVTESAPKTVPKSVTKAHANCDARHEMRAPSIDVDEDVFRNNCLNTSTSTYAPMAPEPVASEPRTHQAIAPESAYESIRRALASATDADEDQISKDRQTAWKAACVIADHLGKSFLDQVLQSAAKSAPKRPYAYLYVAIERKLQRDGLEAKRLFAAVNAPANLVDPPDCKLRLERPVPPAKRAAAASVPIAEQRAARQAELAGMPSAKELFLAARSET